MSSRIGTLHVDYRANGRSHLAAMVPQLDRLLAARLGGAIDERLPTLLGNDLEVVVIREVRAQATIRLADWSLDRTLLDAMGRASIDAIGEALAAPPDDDRIVRFADQAEFIGSFIVDLLARSAWERWYFGAFHRYRQSDDAATIGAILDDNRAHAVGVFGWLARRGHLDALLARLGPDRARQLVTPRDADVSTLAARHEFAPLITAGFQILDALGWSIGDATARAALTAHYLATQPVPPTWTDRRSLSAWVFRFVRFVVASAASQIGRGAPLAGDVVLDLLRGGLDWLDVDWLAPQLHYLATSPAGASTPKTRSSRRVLTATHERSLDRLADLIRLRRVRLLPDDDVDAIVVRLMAALNDSDGAGEPDRALVAAIDRIARALVAAMRSGLNAEDVLLVIAGRSRSDMAIADVELSRRIDDVTDLGPSAELALQQLVAATMDRGPAGDPTAAGGLFLLTRALIDVRLHALVREAGVPFDGLKAALAAWWLDLSAPFDAGAALWMGATSSSEPLTLDASADGLRSLEAALLDVLQDQRAFDALPPDETIDPEPGAFVAPGMPGEIRQAIARIGWMLLRAWSRWLPGVGQSQRPFLVRNCLRRGARLRVTTTAIAVELDPAPLDIVLEMAGYLRPIERVSWLDDRTITFSVRRRA
jgi:hypothetical protein